MKGNQFEIHISRPRNRGYAAMTCEIPEASSLEDAIDVIERAMEARSETLQTKNIAHRLEVIGDRIEKRLERTDLHVAQFYQKTQETKDETVKAIKEALTFDKDETCTLEECVADVLIDDEALADKIADRIALKIGPQTISTSSPKFAINPALVASERIEASKIAAHSFTADQIAPAAKISDKKISCDAQNAKTTDRQRDNLESAGLLLDQLERLDKLAKETEKNVERKEDADITRAQVKIAETMCVLAMALNQ